MFFLVPGVPKLVTRGLLWGLRAENYKSLKCLYGTYRGLVSGSKCFWELGIAVVFGSYVLQAYLG